MNIQRILIHSMAALGAVVMCSATAQGQTNGTWTNLTGGSWPVTTNWTGGVVANGVGALADFSTLNITANATVTLDGARTVGTLKFQDATTASNDWILNAGTGDPLTLDVSTGQALIQVLNRTLTIGLVIAGNDGITVNNGGGAGGTLILNGANTFSNQLTVAPTMIVQTGNAAALGTAGAGNETVVQAGGTLNTNGQNLGLEVVRAAGTGVGGIGAIVNNGTAQNNTFATVELTNNATFGGSGRWDIRNGTPLLDLGGFRLTKIAANQISVVGGTISDGIIDVNGGTFSIETNTNVKGFGALTINSGSTLGAFANVAGAQTRPVVLNGGTINELGSGGSTISYPVLLTNSSTITAAGPLTMAADINESGGQFGITKNGASSLTLTGTANFSGPLNVTAGAFAFGAGSAVQSRVISVASGATFNAAALGGYTLPAGGTFTVGRSGAAANDVLGGLRATPGSTISLNTGGTSNTATFANGLTIDNTNLAFDIGGAAPDQIAVTGNLAVTGVNPITLRPYGTSGITPGNYSLFTYTSGSAPALANFTLTNAGNFRQTISPLDPATTPNAVQIAVSGSAASLTWSGDGAGNVWNVNGATAWRNGATPDKFFELDAVTFDAAGSANPTVTLATPVTPASVTVNAANAYTITGPGKIGGNSGIAKSGAGALIFTGFAHDYLGALNVTNGKIVGPYLPNSGVASSFGAGLAMTLDGGAIEVNGATQATNRTFTLGAASGTIFVTDPLAQLNLVTAVGGTGGLIKDGPGALRIDAVATFTGNITVNGGVLRPNSTTALGSKMITVNNGATFDPNGQTGAGGRPVMNIIGTGVPGQAAIWNGGGAQTNNPLYGVVNLTGDASMGSNVRYDLNGGAGLPAGLTFNGGTFALTKVGVGEMWWAPNIGATVGSIVVEAGRFGVQSSSNLGDATSSIVVNPGGELSSFAAVINDKPIRLNGGNFMNNNDATTATWTGGLSVSAPSFISGNANTTTRVIQLTSPTFSLGGNTLTKINRAALTISDATNGTGPGNFVVLGGPVTFNSGSLVNGAGVLAIKADGLVNIDDTGGAVVLSKNTQLDGGTLASLNGSHTIGNVNVTGHGVLRNGTAATTLTVPNITVPRGSGVTFSTTGDIVLNNLNSAPLVTGRLPAGFTAGPAANALLPAQWDGAKIVTVPTTDTNFAAPAATSIELVNGATTLSADTTVDSLVADTTVTINDSSLLRLNAGTLILRGNANFQITTGTTAASGQLTSGASNGELHITEGISFGTAGGDSGIRVRLVDNPLAGGAFKPMKLVKQGSGGLTDLGFDGTNGFDNSYTGGTLINNGRIPISSSLALGTGLVTIRDGGQVAFFNSTGARGNFLPNNFNIAGTGAAENNGPFGALRFGIASQTFSTIGGNVALADSARVHNQNTNDGILAGVISGPSSAALTKTGGNVIVLANAANTYTGRTEIGSRDQITSGAINVFKLANGGLPSSLGASANDASNLLIQANGVLRYVGGGDSTDRLFTLGNSFNVNAIPTTTIETIGYGSLNFTNGGNLEFSPGSYRTLVLSAPASTLGIYLNGQFRENTFAPLLGNPTQGFGQLQKTGVGKWTLTTNQTYGGTTTVTDGVLQLGNGATAGNISTNTVTLQNNGDLVVNHSNNVTLAQPIIGVAANDTEVVQAGTGTTTLSGVIDNASTRVRVESGILVLGKTSTPIVHSAAIAVTVNGGTLQLGGSGDDQVFDGTATGGAAGNVFMNGGVFDMNGRNEGLSRIEGSAGSVVNNAAGSTSTLTLGTGNVSSLVGVGTPLQNGAGTFALAKTGTGTISIIGDGNTFSGGTTVNQGVLAIGNGGATGSLPGAIVVNAGGTVAVNHSNFFALTNAISGTGDFAQIGVGATQLNAPKTYQGATVVGNGVLRVDLSTANNVLPPASQLRLNGGLIAFGGPATPSSQTISGQFIVAGGNVHVNDSATLNLPGTWTRTTGGTVDFGFSAPAAVNSAIPNVNNVIGTGTAAYATHNGTNWARQSGSNTIVPFTAYAANTYAPGTHTNVTGDFAFGATTTTGTLRFGTLGAIDLGLDGQTLVLDQAGILATDLVGANPITISNGTLTGAGATGSEVIVHQYTGSGGMTVSAVIADNGANATTFTKAGDGVLVLTGANSYTGGTHINGGTLQVGAGGTAGALGQGIVLNDATLLFNRSDNVAVLNPIGGYGSVAKRGAGILNLRGTNNFTGGLIVSQGTVATDGPQSLGLATITLGDANTGANNVALLSDLGGDISNNIVVANSGTGTATIGSSSSGPNTDAAIFSGRITLNRNTVFQASNTDRTTYTGVIEGASNLSFTAGRTTLENNNTFVGNISVEAGATLQVGTGSFANIRNQIPDASTVTLNGTGAFRINGDSEIIAQLNSTSNTSTLQAIAGGPTVLTLTNGGSFAGAFDGGINTGLTLENTGGTLTLSGTGDNATGRILVNGGTVVLAKTSSAGVHAAAVDVTVNTGLLQLGGTGGDQIWDGSATNRTQVVINGGVFDLNGMSEAFSVLNGLGGIVRNDVAATTSTLTLGTNNWSNSAFFGSVQNGTGTVALTKIGAGGLILAGSNTYTGATIISGGILQLGNGSTGGSLGAGAVNNSGTLVFNRSDAFTFANLVDGTGRVVQNGTGTTTLSGADTYTGSTTVNAGALLVTGSISASSVTVNESGTLGGTGSTGPVAAVTGGTVAPGSSIGTLNTGAFSLFDGSILSLEIGATTADQVNVTGAALLEGTIALGISLTADPVDNTAFTVINSTAGVTGYTAGARFVFGTNRLDDGELFFVNSGAFNQIFAIDYDADTGKDVVLIAVPEPATVLALAGGMGALLGFRRLRRRSA